MIRTRNSKSSSFIRPMHPKTEISPNREAIERVLSAGWVGQLKIHGHRAQIHVPSNHSKKPVVYTRQGGLHKKELSQSMIDELKRLFRPTKGWNVIDAEWIKGQEKLFIFDFIKKDGQILSRKNYLQRYQLLPKDFISPHIQLLPIYKGIDQCLQALKRKEDYIEGLVFKSTSRAGFEDTSIVRCRRTPSGVS